MENRRIIKTATILGGALISALLITSNSVFAYNQDKTHPALTDEIVDFYNLNFPANKLTEQEKQWLILGAIEEDIGERPIFHFYDPVNNRGISHFSSKEWALKPSVQANYYNSQLTGFAAISGADSANDFSYGIALDDYAKGDRERAFIAFGHTLHLLEDAGVPDHTRGDPHPPVLDWGSPYEHEMAKWNPQNFQIARKLFLTREKPIALDSMVDYFDKISNYSNNNFFSKDTINNNTYSQPSIKITKKIKVNGTERLFVVRDDLPLAFVAVDSVTGSIIDIKLIKPEIGTFILDGYWDRLSKEVVLNGAGALNLFLTEAEKAKQEYANKPTEKNWFARLLGLIGVEISGLTMSDIVSPQGVDNSNIGDIMVTPKPEVTNLSVSPIVLVTKTPNTNVTMMSPTLSPSRTPLPTMNPKTTATNSGGGGGGGGSSSTSIPSPSVSPTPSLSPSLSMSPSPTPTPSPSPILSPSPSPTPSAPSFPISMVVINEIGWMGTATSSNDEWIELYNTTANQIDLSGWTLKSKDGTPNISLSGNIGSFGFYLLERTADTTISDILVDKTYSGALGNGGESLELHDGSGNLKDSADFASGWPAGDNTTKSSMERIDPRQSGDNAINWATNNGITKNGHDAAGQPINGTPRSKNSVYVSLKPSSVTNLAVTGLDGNFGRSILTWSAPSDPDTLPINLAYDLRYATKSFVTIDDWDAAYHLASMSLPSVAEGGAPTSASFDILNSYNQKWFFALKTKLPTCDVGNCEESDISNIAENITKSALSDSWSTFGANRYHTSFYNTEGVVPIASQKATISWEFDIGAGNYIGQPVISEKDNIYFGFSDGKFYSLDKNGSKSWQYTGSSGKSDGPVVLADGTTYFGHNMSGVSDITALNPDGSLKWIYYTSGTGPLTLTEDGTVYFSSWDGKLNALKPDGSLKWQANGPFGSFSPIILQNGNVINSSRVSGTPHFQAYSSSGVEVWDTPFALGYDYLPSHPSFDLDTGKINSAVGPHLVQISETGELLKTLIDTKGISTTMVSVSPSNLIIGLDFTNYNPASGSQVIALTKSTHEIKWRFKVDFRINNQIAIDKNENVYFSTQNGKLYGLNKNGELMWVIDVAASTDISPVLSKQSIIWGYGNRLTSIVVK